MELETITMPRLNPDLSPRIAATTLAEGLAEVEARGERADTAPPAPQPPEQHRRLLTLRANAVRRGRPK